MYSSVGLDDVERIIGRPFKDRAFLEYALTSADRWEESVGTDGNRGLAFIGDPLIKLVISIFTLLDHGNRSEGHDKCESFLRNNVLANIAIESGLDRFVQPSSRQKERPLPNGVLGKAVKAIMAASWLDAGGDLKVINDMISRLSRYSGIKVAPLTHPVTAASSTTPESINPALLSIIAPDPQTQTEQVSVASNFETFPFNGSASNEPRSNSLYITSDNSANSVDNAESEFGTLHAEPSLPFRSPGLAEGYESCDCTPVQSQDAMLNGNYVRNDNRRRALMTRPPAARSRTRQRSSTGTTPVPPMPRETFQKARLLDDFIRAERVKCSSTIHQESMHHLRSAGQHIARFGLDECAIHASIFYYLIPSHASVIGLRNILCSYRQRDMYDLSFFHNLSNTQRYHLIRKFETEIGCFAFWRRYHVWRLYVSCLCSHSGMDSGFIVSTQASQRGKRGAVPGNPILRAKSRTIDAMIHEVVPGFDELSADKQRASRTRVRRLAMLGARLQKLARNVGPGVLALLPPAFDAADGDESLCITDASIVKFKDDEFDKLVRLLSSSEAPFKMFSKAAQVILESILRNQTSNPQRFLLEEASIEEISSHPGGSKALLRYFAQLHHEVNVDIESTI